VVICCCVKFFGSEKFFVAKLPGSLQHLHMKKVLEFAGDVLKESEDPAFRVFVAKRVEYEAFFGYEGISISGNPIS
jgi:hypothetical protein